jgi:gliding motility-associated protein GldM
MSLPKEPRQLMITIMYLVLTAMLALNVSAEIFNAFKILDHGLVKSSEALDFTNKPMQEAIHTAAKAKPSLQTYAERVDPIRQESKALSEYIEGIRDSIISNSGGFRLDSESKEFTEDLKGEKDIDVATRILVKNPSKFGNSQTMGEELKESLISFQSKMLEHIDPDDRAHFQKEIAVNVDDKTWREKGKPSWSHMTFNRMPVQAVVPLLNKYVNDVKSSEAAALNYLGKKVGIGKEDVVIDGFAVVAAPEKSYIIKGEPYNADIFLTAAAGPNSGTKVKLSVNGRPLSLDSKGKGQYSVNTSVTGPKKYTATAKVYNPITEETTTYTKEFTYEVGERSVAISPSKMNVFYVGVDNPVEISAAGYNSNTMKTSMSGPGGGTIRKAADGSFIVNVKTPTKRNEYAKVNVSADGLNTSKNFRVKRIPNPIPKVSNKKSGAISSGEFKLQRGVFPVLENFDFQAECTIEEFRLVRVPKRSDVMVQMNKGGLYSPQSKAIVEKARAGDKYYFEDIKCKCPGDIRQRDLGSMAFRIN